MNTVYLNGKFLPLEEARISVMDRGFLFADGVYEVIPIYHGRFFKLTPHLKRLQQSLKAIHLNVDISLNQWQEILTTLLSKNAEKAPQKIIYLQVTRGISDHRSHIFPEKTHPTVFARITNITPKPVETLQKGFSAITHDDIRWHYDYIKSISLLPNVLLSQQAREADANETILIYNGHVTEGASSNVFIVKDNIVKTPPLNKRILGGITRDFVLVLLNKHNESYEETMLAKEDLYAADEIWITSSTREIYPITAIDKKPIGTGSTGPLWKRIIKYYRAAISGGNINKIK